MFWVVSAQSMLSVTWAQSMLSVVMAQSMLAWLPIEKTENRESVAAARRGAIVYFMVA